MMGGRLEALWRVINERRHAAWSRRAMTFCVIINYVKDAHGFAWIFTESGSMLWGMGCSELVLFPDIPNITWLE